VARRRRRPGARRRGDGAALPRGVRAGERLRRAHLVGRHGAARGGRGAASAAADVPRRARARALRRRGRPAAGPRAPAPPRFLPEYDNVALAHEDRSRLFAGLGPGAPLPRGGRAIGTLLVDGFYRANWQVAEGRDAATLTIDRFAPRGDDPTGTVEAIVAEGNGLLAFLAPDVATRRVQFIPALKR